MSDSSDSSDEAVKEIAMLPKIKSVPFQISKTLSPILWMAAFVVIPEIITDLSALKPQELYWKWGLRFIIAALKIALDKYSHQAT